MLKTNTNNNIYGSGEIVFGHGKHATLGVVTEKILLNHSKSWRFESSLLYYDDPTSIKVGICMSGEIGKHAVLRL